jgi:hypothetical protein
MFDQQPEARPLPQVRNRRTNSWIMIVPTRMFLDWVEVLHPVERLACVAPQPQREPSGKRFDPRSVSEVILAVLLAGGAIAVACIFWP